MRELSRRNCSHGNCLEGIVCEPCIDGVRGIKNTNLTGVVSELHKHDVANDFILPEMIINTDSIQVVWTRYPTLFFMKRYT